VKNRSLLLAVVLVLLIAPVSYAFIDALIDEAIDSSRRYAVAMNYERAINECIAAYKNIDEIILDNPSMDAATGAILNLFAGYMLYLYDTALISLGIYMLFVSGSPQSRSKAKASFILLLLSMGINSLSPHILNTMFSLSHALAQNVFSYATVDVDAPYTNAANYLLDLSLGVIGGKDDSSAIASMPGSGVEGPGITLLLLTYVFLEATLLALKMRFFVLAILAAFFPVTILLYALAPTQRLGRFLASQTVLWTFSQVAMALVLVTVAVGVKIAGSVTTVRLSADYLFIMEVTGLIFLMLTPLAVMFLFGGVLRRQ
jgi:hypothetical protein